MSSLDYGAGAANVGTFVGLVITTLLPTATLKAALILP
jgi:hypothetical protein